MSILNEFLSYRKFLKKTEDEKKEIVFFSEHEGYYSYFEGLIEELTEKHGRTISYVTAEKNDPVLQTNNPLIRPFYINILLPLFLQSLNSKVLIMTMPDINRFHIKRAPDPVNHIYMFHSLVSTNMMYLKGAFDHYDTVFCCGGHHVEEIKKAEQIYSTPKKKLINSGYYRLERIQNAREKSPEPDSRHILIAPSWGENNILESIGKELTSQLLENGYKITIRPHPETIRRTPQIINELETEFKNNPDFKIEKSVSTDDSLLECGLLICDCSGVALEYAFGAERPVLFIDVPYKIRNKDYKEIGEPIELDLRNKIGKLISPDEASNINTHIKDIYDNLDSYKNTIKELRSKYVFNPGESSKIEAEYIVNRL